ncbi:hypothetical protein ElyMa_003153900 [Elysia marginata]|uniref:Uncharacterized protein n=1 Tax=Elysia marginata TaxID=1093978 RepID=A0AAV4IU40_9GAST|nr:hypothetical protein ElyMa_003153900 [Elysia marginata]
MTQFVQQAVLGKGSKEENAIQGSRVVSTAAGLAGALGGRVPQLVGGAKLLGGGSVIAPPPTIVGDLALGLESTPRHVTRTRNAALTVIGHPGVRGVPVRKLVGGAYH